MIRVKYPTVFRSILPVGAELWTLTLPTGKPRNAQKYINRGTYILDGSLEIGSHM